MVRLFSRKHIVDNGIPIGYLLQVVTEGVDITAKENKVTDQHKEKGNQPLLPAKGGPGKTNSSLGASQVKDQMPLKILVVNPDEVPVRNTTGSTGDRNTTV